MNRVMCRTWVLVLFLWVLVGGMAFFLWEYANHAAEWAGYPSSPHVQDGGLGGGTVTDRTGQLLLRLGEERSYSPDAEVRQGTLHWLGDRRGNISAPAISHYRSVMSGYDLIQGVYRSSSRPGSIELTLSARLQTAALTAMADRKGTVAVYNYKTGELLCAVTTPTFDPDNEPDIAGDTTGYYEGVYLNRFLRSAYIPGSIFKVVTTAAALDCVEGVEDMTFTCYGALAYGDQSVTCEKAHGTLDLSGALAHSCNCCFAQIAELVGKKAMTGYVKKFRLLESLQFDGITTAEGNYDVSDAAPVSFAWSCIGQYTDLVNPCRFLTFMGAIARGGTELPPHVVRSVYDGEEETYHAQPTAGQRIMSQEVARILQGYMRSNVLEIYGAEHFPGLTVCAKSGTSELGGGLTSNSMFAGFVTDEAYPLAFIVVVENGGYGSTTCVPILSQVLSSCKEVLDEPASEWS